MDGTPGSSAERDLEALLAALAALPDELDRTIAGRPTETLLRPSRDGGWGAIENMCHLRDWEEIFVDRARAIVDQDRPELPAYDDELWAIERDYRGQNPERVMQRLRALREEFVGVLKGVPPEGWARTGYHADRGEIDLRWLAEHALQHGEEHLALLREAMA